MVVFIGYDYYEIVRGQQERMLMKLPLSTQTTFISSKTLTKERFKYDSRSTNIPGVL